MIQVILYMCFCILLHIEKIVFYDNLKRNSTLFFIRLLFYLTFIKFDLNNIDILIFYKGG